MRLFIFNMVFLIYVCVVAFLLFTDKAKAGEYTFNYKTSNELKITVRATDYRAGFNKAAKQCFEILSKGTYQGETAGLEFIDVCVNPKVK